MTHGLRQSLHSGLGGLRLACPLLGSGCLWVAILLMIPATGLTEGPAPGRETLGPGGGMRIDAHDRCPVCAMLPIRYPRFAAAIERRDARTYYFCSPGCMLRAWLQPDLFLGISAELLKRPLVLEYLSGETLDAREVFWVSGSDVVGPMGPALVPLKNRTHLEAFRRRHGGQHVFRLKELNHANWEHLTGKQSPNP
ncbi:MAG: nitrous oxide reductase accessory protein NosL [Desulfobacterales bacterium]